MKRISTLICFIFLSHISFAQFDASTYDFWVGEWDLTWQDPNGGTGKGKNVIEKILDDKVIQEHFTALEGAYKGMKGTSISVYNPRQKTWHQTWQDNQGSNLVFNGRQADGKKYFETEMNNNTQSRMVFYDFNDEGFTWDWEATTDGGKNWTLNWRINYKKAK